MSTDAEQFMQTGKRYIRRTSRIYTIVLTLLGAIIVAAAIGVTRYTVPVVSETHVMYGIAGVAGAMTVGVWVYAFRIGRNVLNPLDDLRKQAAQLDKADPQVTLDTKRPDEIGDVNRAFSNLTYVVDSRMAEVEKTLQETAEFTEEVASTAESFGEFGKTARVANEDLLAAVETDDVEGIMTRQSSTGNPEEEIELGAESSFSSLKELNDTVAELDRTTELLHQVATDTNYLALNAGVEATDLESEVQGFTEATDEIQELSAAIADSVENIEDVHANVQNVITVLVEELLRQQMILAHALTYHGEGLDEKAVELHETLDSLQMGA